MLETETQSETNYDNNLSDQGYTIFNVWSTACWLGETIFRKQGKSLEKVAKNDCNILSEGTCTHSLTIFSSALKGPMLSRDEICCSLVAGMPILGGPIKGCELANQKHDNLDLMLTNLVSF